MVIKIDMRKEAKNVFRIVYNVNRAAREYRNAVDRMGDPTLTNVDRVRVTGYRDEKWNELAGWQAAAEVYERFGIVKRGEGGRWESV